MLTLAAWQRGKPFAWYKHYLLQYLHLSYTEQQTKSKETRKCDLPLWKKKKVKRTRPRYSLDVEIIREGFKEKEI